MAASLVLEGIRKRRGGDGRGFLLSVESLVLHRGDAIAILGPSGSGKSTLVELLGLASRPDAGRYELVGWDGARTDLAAFWQAGDHEALAGMRARHFGYVPQTGALLPFLDVRGNIEMPQRLSGRIDPARLAAVAKALGIDGLMRHLPGTLSVGQRQRVAVARAIAHRPAFVLADEPTAALDPANAEVVMGLLADMVRRDGAALVVVTHDAALAHRFRLRCIELSCLVEDGRWHSAVPTFDGVAA